jgi:hypothetical protein
MAPKEQDRKGGLTLEKLISYDDVITDALVDKVGIGHQHCKFHDRAFSGTMSTNRRIRRSTFGRSSGKTVAGAFQHREDCKRRTLLTYCASMSS